MTNNAENQNPMRSFLHIAIEGFCSRRLLKPSKPKWQLPFLLFVLMIVYFYYYMEIVGLFG